MFDMKLPMLAALTLAACGPAGDRSETAAVDSAGQETAMGARQGAADTTAAPETGRAGAQPPRLEASGILSQLGTANAAEIASAQRALDQSKSAEVRRIANKLVDEHQQNSQKATQLAQTLDVRIVEPEVPKPTGDSAARAGGTFSDRQWVEQQIAAHQQNITRLRDDLIPSADRQELRAFLQETLTAMEGHLRELEQTQQRLGSR